MNAERWHLSLSKNKFNSIATLNFKGGKRKKQVWFDGEKRICKIKKKFESYRIFSDVREK